MKKMNIKADRISQDPYREWVMRDYQRELGKNPEDDSSRR